MRTHGDTGSAEYHAWEAMLARCNNPRHPRYRLYGARGIAVCRRWLDYSSFLADVGRKPTPKHSLDRIDNNRGYEPGNCRWATQTEQLANRRGNVYVVVNGERLCVAAAARQYGVNERTLRWRIKSGWSVEQALSHRKGA